MSDEEVPAAPDPTPEPDAPAPEADDDDALLEASAQVDAKTGQKMIQVPLGVLVGLRKNNRELKGKLRDTEPQLQRAAGIEQRLAQVQPVINAVLADPKLRAEATRIAQGTRASHDTTEQPDDAEAVAFAEDSGFYLSDGVTPDALRARRVLAHFDKRTARTAEAAVRPFANIAVGSRAEGNLRQAITMTHADGRPLASEESIREVAAALGPELLANPEVIDKILINTAIGIDARKGRVPRIVDEDRLVLDSAGSGRGRREVSISASEKQRLERLGLSEKEFIEAGRKIAASPRGIALE